MRIDDFSATVGDRGEAFESKNRKRNRRHEINGAAGDRLARKGAGIKTAGPDRGHGKNDDPANFNDRHDQGEHADGAIARCVDCVGQEDQAERQKGQQQPTTFQAERTQCIGREGPSHEAFIDDHRKRHKQRCGSSDGPGAICLVQDHGDAARRRPGVRHLDVAVGRERRYSGAHNKRERKERSGKLRDLSGQCENTRADHDAGSHRDRAA